MDFSIIGSIRTLIVWRSHCWIWTYCLTQHPLFCAQCNIMFPTTATARKHHCTVSRELSTNRKFPRKFPRTQMIGPEARFFGEKTYLSVSLSLERQKETAFEKLHMIRLISDTSPFTRRVSLWISRPITAPEHSSIICSVHSAIRCFLTKFLSLFAESSRGLEQTQMLLGKVIISFCPSLSP